MRPIVAALRAMLEMTDIESAFSLSRMRPVRLLIVGATKGQQTNAYPPLFDDDYASLLECVGHVGEIGQHERCLLFWTSLRRTAQQDHRRFDLRPQRQQRSEIGICRDKNPLLLRRKLEDCWIWSRLHVPVTNMFGVVSRLSQPLTTAGDNALSTRNFTQP